MAVPGDDEPTSIAATIAGQLRVEQEATWCWNHQADLPTKVTTTAKRFT